MSRLFVTGATGLLGCSLVPLLKAKGHEVFSHGYTGAADFNADLRTYAETANILNQAAPDIIINLAALTNVDVCEVNPHNAYLLNVRSVENLCNWIKQENSQCHLIQISTDQVYDGIGPHPEAQIRIENYYAFSKIAAEIAASAVPSTVLRTNFFGRSLRYGRPSFSDWLFQALQKGEEIKVFEDILFSPLALPTLVSMLELSVRNKPQGVFNLGSNQGMSKADFAFAFADALGMSTRHMRRTQSIEMATLRAYRPKDMRMDCSLFEQAMGLRLPQLINEINMMRSDYLEQS